MRTHTLIGAAAIVLSAVTLFPACGGPDVVTTQVVVTKKEFVCADKTHVDDPDLCPPGPVETITKTVCQYTGQAVEDASKCPTWVLSCPEGTTAYGNSQTGETGCMYKAVCEDGWLYNQATGKCQVVCEPGFSISKDGTCQPVTFATACGEGSLLNTQTGECQPTNPRDCPENEYVGVDGDCHQVPTHGLVYVGKRLPERSETHEIRPGEQGFAFGLSVRSDNRDIILSGVAFELYVSATGDHSTWDNRQAVVSQFIQGCTFYPHDGPLQPEAAVTVSRDTPNGAEVEFSSNSMNATGAYIYADLWCRTNPALQQSMRFAAVLRRVHLTETSGGYAQHVVFGSTNVDFSQQVHIVPRPPCAPPTISLASGSPSGAGIPGFSEVLRYNVSANSCGYVGLHSVTFTVSATDNTNGGSGFSSWLVLNMASWQLYDASNTSTPIPVSQITFGNRTVTFDINEEVGAGETKTYILKVDTSGASAANDDSIRVDITDIGWSDAGLANADGSLVRNLPVTGGTIVY